MMALWESNGLVQAIALNGIINWIEATEQSTGELESMSEHETRKVVAAELREILRVRGVTGPPATYSTKPMRAEVKG
jgi:hypothetical protein